MHVCVLASGSGGNATWVESGGVALLVDCGLTVPELRRRLARAGLDERRLAAIAVTHDHSDHTGSAAVLAKKLGLPLHATAGTLQSLARLPPELARVVRADEPFEAAGLKLVAFSTPHDAREPVGLRIEGPAGRTVAIATDIGYVARALVARLAGANLLVLEHNHDKRMLLEGPYPEVLKRRILSTHGHLSNEEGAQLAAQVAHEGLRRVVLGHLSETNNTPDLARAAFERVNAGAHGGLRLDVAAQDSPTDVFEA